MPIIDADKARICFCIKRSMNPGFAGIENALYSADHTYMLFGDAKQVVGELAKQLGRTDRHALVPSTDCVRHSRIAAKCHFSVAEEKTGRLPVFAESWVE